MHSKTHIICLAAGQPTGRTYSTRDTPTLWDRERVLMKVGQKAGNEKRTKGKRKTP